MVNIKKNLILMIIGAFVLIAIVLGATYAYFTAQGGGTGNIDVNAGTATTDNLSFQVGSAISLTANQEDFGSGMGNKSGSTYAKATLTANNATNNATRNYYVYLDITSNNFEYTTDKEQAELLLKVIAPDGTELTTLGNLERKTSGGETGFDITNQTGSITIADNYEITSTGIVTQEWQVEVIFANLDSDQNVNTGKSFSANLIIQEDPMRVIVNLASYITNTLYTEDGVNGLYYHDGTGSYTNSNLEAEDNSYRYAGADPNNYVCFGSDETICPADNLYRIIGVFDRQVKLIKSDSAEPNILGAEPVASGEPDLMYYKGSLSQLSTYYWINISLPLSNIWSNSTLNTDILNGTYITTIGFEWENMISDHVWIVGGNNVSNLRETNAKSAYNSEIISPGDNATYNAKVGLMYISDYYYGADPTNWAYKGFDRDTETDYRLSINDNWISLGIYEWTISRRSENNSTVFYIAGPGFVNDSGAQAYFSVRPVFYLNSDVQIYEGHFGTASDPYRIVL